MRNSRNTLSGMDLLTTAEAAKVLGVTPRRVRQLKDRIGYSVFVGVMVFERRAVLRFQKQGKRSGGWPKGRKRKS